MKNFFISVNSRKKADLSVLKNLPSKLAIAYSSQYHSQAKKVEDFLSKKHSILNFFQALGCTSPEISEEVEGILLISDGKFHALGIASDSRVPIYLYNLTRLEKILPKEMEELKRKGKRAYLRFLNSRKVGILISTKKGQNRTKNAFELKRKLVQKRAYLFVCENVDIAQFENFPEIDSWINTACPRLDMESEKILNFSNLGKLKV
jgi:diphthamide biosynthesis enzyme Dph1/Dph2-like protein